MTRQIRIAGEVFNRDEVVFIEGGIVATKRDLIPLNVMEDGTIVSAEVLPDELSRAEEDLLIDPSFLKVIGALEAAEKELHDLAHVLRLTGLQGCKDARGFANAAAANVMQAAYKVLNSCGRAHRKVDPLFEKRS